MCYLIQYNVCRRSLLYFFPILNGKTVLLRQLKSIDAKSISMLLTHEVATYLKVEIPNSHRIYEAKKFIKYSHQRFKSKKALIFAIELEMESDNAVSVGIISIKNIDVVNKNSEIRYWIGKGYWRKGIATEYLNLATS